MIGVIGGNGFVGAELCKKFEAISITKQNYNTHKNKIFDVLINANGNSKKFWAESNALEDFKLSTLSVYNSLLDFKFKKYIYISSVDVDGNSTYGFHKKISEDIIKKYVDDYIILRCSSIIGKGMKKGVIKDILDGNKIFITPTSMLQFITNTEIANIIETIISKKIKNETFNIAGKCPIKIEKLGDLLNKKIIYASETEEQYYNRDVTKVNSIFKLKKSKDYILDILREYNERME